MRVGICASVLITSLLCAGALSAQERYTLAGRDVAIYNLAGKLQITAGTGNDVVVEVTRVGADAKQLRIASGDIEGANTLRVIYQGDVIVYRELRGSSSSDAEVRDDGTFGRGAGRRIRIVSPARAGRGALEAAADMVVRVPTGVRLHAHWIAGAADVQNVNGNLAVENAMGEITANGVQGQLKLSTASGSIDARDLDAETDINSASGSIVLTNVRGAGLKANAASGSIHAEQVRSRGVDVETASGEIRVRDVTADHVRLNTASGAITAEGISAPSATLHTASGSIDGDLNGNIKELDAGTASGSVRLRLPANADAQLDVSTSSGAINLDMPHRVTEQRRGRVHAVLGQGTGRISINTASGAVTLYNR